MIRPLIATLCVALTLGATHARAGETRSPRLVTIGGAVTEIVYALGVQSQLVARDSTSNFPPAAADLPDVGYMRALSAEGVLGMKPDLVIAMDGSGPPEQLSLLKDSGVRVEMVPEGYDAAAVITKIETIGRLVGRSAEAAALAQQVSTEFQLAASASARPKATQKRVLFILSLQDGKIMAAGQNSSADAMITLAGGVNALNGFSGFKAVSPEALVAARPDVILMMMRANHGADAKTVFANPALALTPAASNGALILMDGQHLLGFGPRTASAIRALSEEIYGREP